MAEVASEQRLHPCELHPMHRYYVRLLASRSGNDLHMLQRLGGLADLKSGSTRRFAMHTQDAATTCVHQSERLQAMPACQLVPMYSGSGDCEYVYLAKSLLPLLHRSANDQTSKSEIRNLLLSDKFCATCQPEEGQVYLIAHVTIGSHVLTRHPTRCEAFSADRTSSLPNSLSELPLVFMHIILSTRRHRLQNRPYSAPTASGNP